MLARGHNGKLLGIVHAKQATVGFMHHIGGRRSPSFGLASTFWPQPARIKLAAKLATAAAAIIFVFFMASGLSWSDDLLSHGQIQLRGRGQV